MANKVNIGLSIKGVLEKYGLERKYYAGFSAIDTFDSVVQEVVTIQASDASDAGTPSDAASTPDAATPSDAVVLPGDVTPQG